MSAACHVLAGEPAAQHGDPRPAQPGRFGVIRPAQFPRIDDLLQRLDVPAPAVVEGNVQDASGPAGSVDHLLSFATVAGNGFFAEDMESAVEGGDGDRSVEERGNRNADGVQVLQLQQLLPAGKRIPDAVPALQLGKEVSFHAGNGHHFHTVHPLVGLDVLPARPTNPDNSNFEVLPVSMLLVQVEDSFAVGRSRCRNSNGFTAGKPRTGLPGTGRLAGPCQRRRWSSGVSRGPNACFRKPLSTSRRTTRCRWPSHGLSRASMPASSVRRPVRASPTNAAKW
jgi:hypothetical protein